MLITPEISKSRRRKTLYVYSMSECLALRWCSVPPPFSSAVNTLWSQLLFHSPLFRTRASFFYRFRESVESSPPWERTTFKQKQH